ncbi:MAG: MFS transporter [Chloroflexota bacterium]
MSAQLQQMNASEKANFNHLVGDIAWFGLAMAATTRFLSVYAIRLGATPIDLGWISALPALLVLISASFGAWWGRRYGNLVRSLFLPGLGMRLMFLLPAFAPLLPVQYQPMWLILSVSIPALPQGIAAVSFFVIMRGSVDPDRMTHLLSRRQLAVNVSVAVAVLTFGLWLKGAPFPLNYQVMFLVAFAFSLISLWHCIRIRLDAPKPVAEAKPVARYRATEPWRSPGFRRVAFVTALVHMVFFMLVPVIPLLLVKNLGADEGYMALFGLLELAGGAAASVIAPRVTARVGTRAMIALAMVGTAFSALLIAAAPNLWFALIAAVFSGGCWTAAAGVGLFTLFMDNTPASEATTYSTAFHQVIGLAVFVGPMIGSLLANNGVSLILIIGLGAAVRLIAAPLIDTSLITRGWARLHHEPEALAQTL